MHLDSDIMENHTPPADGIVRSLIIPVYLNEPNIPSLLDAVATLSSRTGEGSEIIFVVDGSPDNSYGLLADNLPTMPFHSQLITLSRNFGSFSAIRCGLEAARGQYFAVMAADLQEPPELVEEFYRLLENDEADIVFGQRKARSDHLITRWVSNLFWFIFRKLVISDIPAGGVDVFGCNAKVRKTILRIEEQGSSLMAQLFWVGFRRTFIPYDRRQRIEGKSAWSFSRRFQYMLDSILSFSDFPIMVLLWVGIIGCIASAGIGALVFWAWFFNLISVPGYTPIMLGVFFVGFLMLLSQGIIGAYLWRVAENTKHRPQAVIANQTVFTPKE